MNLLIYRDDINPENLKPNRVEMDIITKIQARPIIFEMRSDEKTLFWRYRYFLRDYGEALPRFLHSVDWGTRKEDDEAMVLLKKWCSVRIEDALYLLSSYTAANELFINKKNKKPIPCMLEVRKFAVAAISEFSDEIIEAFLL